MSDVFCCERLHAKRKELGLSLEALAKRTKSTKSYIWELENNKGINPSVDKVFLISRALGVSMEWLCGQDMTNDAYAAKIGALAINAVMPHLDLDKVAISMGYKKSTKSKDKASK